MSEVPVFLNYVSWNIGWAHRAGMLLATCVPLSCARVKGAVGVMPVPDTCVPAACADLSGAATVSVAPPPELPQGSLVRNRAIQYCLPIYC